MADMFGIGQVVGSTINTMGNLAATRWNNEYAQQREQLARAENMYYGEIAARHADYRTRALYNDLYSPEAQLKQIKAAGLSPSLFYGDGGGIAGQAGAQGAGTAGVNPTVFGTPNIDFGLAGLEKTMAEIGLMKAQTEKTKSETTQTDLENELKEMQNTAFRTEFEITNSHFAQSDGSQQSIYEMAEASNSYKQFVDNVREAANEAENLSLRDATTTEQGQQILRQIYNASYQMQRDISVLSNDKVNADFHKSITNELRKEGFAKLNAEQAITEIRRNVETDTLDARQKEAFNNLIKKLEKSGSTTSDIVITLLLIVNNALSNYRLPSTKTYNITNQK